MCNLKINISKKFFSVIIFFIFGFNGSSQTCSLTTWDFPFPDDADYGWSCGLYLPNQVGGAQIMTQISMSLFGPVFMDESFPNQDIYIRHTNDLEYTSLNNSYPGTAGFTHVFSGTLNFNSGDGIYTFPFNMNNFAYNGSQAIEVMFLNNSDYQAWDGFEFHRTDYAPSGPNIGKYGSSNSSLSDAQAFSSWGPFNLALQFNNVGSPCSYPLPVELNSAQIQCNEEDVNLEWSTFTETNNNYFEIEYSTDGENWRKIGRVEGAGTTTEVQDYKFNLNKYVLQSVTYLRLSQVDYDGSRDELKVLSINCNDFEKKVSAYPNPFRDILNIEIYQIPEKIELFDMSARKVNTIYSINTGKVLINTEDLNEGIYVVKLYYKDIIETIQVVKL